MNEWAEWFAKNGLPAVKLRGAFVAPNFAAHAAFAYPIAKESAWI